MAAKLRQGPRRPADRPRRARRAVAARARPTARRRARSGCRCSGPPIGVFSLFRLPLGAFQPHDLLYVYEEAGRLAGLLRVERESSRDEWTVVELDAIGRADAGDIRFRLVQHLLRDGARRGAVRFHVACADPDGNVELFMQAGFMRYGDECVLYRPAVPGAARADGPTRRAASCGIRPVTPLDALAAQPAVQRPRRPQPVQRLEDVRAPDWERQGRDWRVPRSSLAPILRFADVEAFVQAAEGRRQGRHAAGRLRPGRRRQGGPAALPEGARTAGRRHRPPARYGLGVIAARGDGRSACIDSVCWLPSGPTNRRSIGASRRTGFDLDRDGHAAHEGNPRPRRRAAPRAGGVR